MKGLPAACAIAAVLLFAFLGARQIRNPDEPREAEIARECAAGEWTTVPALCGKPFLERPPLYYWMTAGAIRLAGEPTDAAARAASALLGIVAVIGVFLAAEALLGAGWGFTAAILMLGIPYLLNRFRTGVGDTGLAAFTALSLGLFLRAHARNSWTLGVAAGIAAGLGFLCKGLLGYAIPTVAALAWLAAMKDLRAILRLRLWAAVVAGLAVAVPWVLALHAAEGREGLHRFFVWNHFGRIGAAADHAQPPWYYVRILWMGLPLAPLLVVAFLRRPDEGRAARLAGLCWVLAPLLLLSLATGKRGVYLLPVLPGFALLGAAVLAGLPDPRWRKWAVAAAGAIALGTAGFDILVAPRRNATASGYALSARIGELAAGRPVLPFRVSEGEIGQFAYAMDRTLPWIWEEKGLRREAAGGPVVVFCRVKNLEEAVASGALSAGAAAALRPIGSGVADGDEYRIYEWQP